ncbi:PaaX family transcriptional regulator [Rhodobacteraceae bacterium M382]|nr:PaaX family transcriptional regulator [Rhodobacteraceae bacterium M382]
MTEKIDSWFGTTVDRLNDPKNQRVWSIIVSLFGDMAQDPKDRISGSALTRVIGPMGIKPEAIRVALHRLRKDGWIDSSRIGRTSVHFLTPSGRAQSAAVTPRIYSHAPEAITSWHVLMAQETSGQSTLEDVMLTQNYISIGRHSALGAGPVPRNCEDLLTFVVDKMSVPNWLRNQIYAPELIETCTDLEQALQGLSQVPTGLSAAQIATLRTLIVHRWRRVVLRHPDLPPEFHPDNWPGTSCRTHVFGLLDQLPRPNLNTLGDPPDH